MSALKQPSRTRTGKTVPLFAQINELRERLTSENADLSSFVFGAVAPQALPLEEAILGACLLDRDAFPIASETLKADDFYVEAHKTIFHAMQQLREKNFPIDLLTVSQYMLDNKLAEEIGGAYFLVELTNKVGSGANVEYHSRVVKQKAFARELIGVCTQATRDAYDGTLDIFDLYDRVNAKTRASNPKSLLRTMKMNEALAIGKKEPVRNHLIGGLIREGDVSILFGDAGTGKSGLAVQIGLNVANGTAMFGDASKFPNACKPLKTLFVDLELETRELFDRYSESDLAFDFGENFFRTDLNPDNFDMEDGGEKIIRALTSAIEKEKPKFVIVDNITWLTSESQDAAVATAFMKTLLKLRRLHDLTILVIAHTPKRNTAEPITANHLAGSKNLVNFAKNLIAVAPSSQDPQKKYIKHLKSRNGMIEYDGANVVTCVLDKPLGSAFLEWKFIGTGDESEHLTKPNLEMSEDELCQKVIETMTEMKLSVERVIVEMSLPYTRPTLDRKIRQYKEKKAKEADFTDFVQSA
jgi:archaellum biogenesis ATPase FlaH